MRWLRVLAMLFSCCWGSASATTFSTDESDLWWNPAESGWGVNVVHQDDTLFVTLFVYGTNGQPTWFVGPSIVYSRATPEGSLVYTGAWYQTSGPAFAGSFNPSAVGVRQVGTATLTFATTSTGVFAYTVDAVAVSKSITRQTWKVNDLTGSYLGGSTGSYSGCSGSVDGYGEQSALLDVTHGGASIDIVVTSLTRTCTFTSRDYSQQGRMGTMAGTYTCTNGENGTFQAFEVEGSLSAFVARVASRSGACTFTGRLGGLFRGP